MKRPLYIFGTTSFAQIAKEYFERTRIYSVEAFVVDDGYATVADVYDRPVTSMGAFRQRTPRRGESFFIAATYTHLNRLRTSRMRLFKSLGYQAASYISPHAFIDPSVELGEHCFIFEQNTLQPFVQIGSNVILWSGNHIGHHSIIEDNVFVSSHVVVSGHCRVGKNSFIGVNASIGNNVCIGSDNWIMPGTALLHDTESNEFWRPELPVRGSQDPIDRFLPPGLE